MQNFARRTPQSAAIKTPQYAAIKTSQDDDRPDFGDDPSGGDEQSTAEIC